MRAELPKKERPKKPLLVAVPRFLLYFLLQILYLKLAFPWIFTAFLFLLVLGMAEGFSWASFARRNPWLVLMAVMPAVLGFPPGWLAGFFGRAGAGLPALQEAWAPALLKSLRLVCIFASAGWLSSRMSPVDLRDVFASLLKPLGKKLAIKASRPLSLTMAFIPWIKEEIKKTDEAARIRGSSARRNAARHLFVLGLPLLSRVLQKAKLSSDALAIRDRAFMEQASGKR